MSMSNDYVLIGTGLSKSFGTGRARVLALRDASLRVRRGEFVVVSGPSGSGKSTLLHVLGLMTVPDTGGLEIDGQSVDDTNSIRTEIRRRKIGFVFQRFNLLGVLSAEDNVAISLRVRGIRPDGRTERLFEQMGISHVASRKPSQMSVGEQQRVAIVRAIAHNPAILLADEPTGNLDSANAAALMELFHELNRQSQQTIVMITHSPEAAHYTDRVLHMSDGALMDGQD